MHLHTDLQPFGMAVKSPITIHYPYGADEVEMAGSVFPCYLHLKKVHFDEIVPVLAKFPRKLKAYS